MRWRWLQNSAGIRYLAEFGVFLDVCHRLEFSLPKLKAMRSLVFGLGLGPGGADDCAGHTGLAGLCLAGPALVGAWNGKPHWPWAA